MRLDHIALATRDASGPLQILVSELGGMVFGGGNAFDFAWFVVGKLDEDLQRVGERILAFAEFGLGHEALEHDDIAVPLFALQFDPTVFNVRDVLFADRFDRPHRSRRLPGDVHIHMKRDPLPIFGQRLEQWLGAHKRWTDCEQQYEQRNKSAASHRTARWIDQSAHGMVRDDPCHLAWQVKKIP